MIQKTTSTKKSESEDRLVENENGNGNGNDGGIEEKSQESSKGLLAIMDRSGSSQTDVKNDVKDEKKGPATTINLKVKVMPKQLT